MDLRALKKWRTFRSMRKAIAGMSESSLHVWRQRARKVLAKSALDSKDDGDNDLTETIAPRPPPGSGGSGTVAEVDEGNPEK